MNKRLFIILDPAHGVDVAGKRSPDGKHLECQWSRKVCSMLYKNLLDLGYQVSFTNISLKEIGLSRRVANANGYLVPEEMEKVLISLHNNAAGNGTEWKTASGVEIFTYSKESKSNPFAQTVIDEFKKEFTELKFRKDYDKNPDVKDSKFTVLSGKYTAVLIEWLFQDNQSDVEKLSDDQYNKKMILTLTNAIEKYNNV
jgi:N-acetylmuramoyl-L-alanine amidase